MSSSSFDRVLDQLYYSAKNPRDKGTKFEKLMQRFLTLEPKYADQFSDVWLWNDWPGRGNHPDTGIDLVAKDRYTDELTAIQCKFYDPERRLEKAHIDSFFTAAGKADFAYGMVVSTTDHWSKHAEEALENQSKPVTRIRLQDLADSTIDWSQFDLDRPQEMVKSPAKAPRRYQREAIDAVVSGLAERDRGKLIMACGTGKTFTSLQILQEQVPAGGTVLFLVPSIALLQQTLNEWTAQATVPLRVFAVCSDTTVGRRQNEDISEHDLGFPATTDPVRLADRFALGSGQDRITVVFSTYQSIDVVYQAQQRGLPQFDLVVCDEAHRTTGIAQANGDASAFVRVHEAGYLKAAKRLYMTATPRIYVEDSKARAAADQVQVYSMDDEAVYGPEFHHLGFGKAVEIGALTDYKVLVLAVDEAMVSRSFQDFLSAEGSDIPLPDVARIVGIWNGLAKRGADGERLAINDHSPMRRAVAFASNIKESKQAADRIERVGQELVVNRTDAQPELSMEAAHVDGTFNVLQRNQRLDWLQEPLAGDTCRILTNAKCLTEGVDVPSLDAVLFLNPRNSQVDVVQAVGRVMRRAEGKEYGYIVLPIAVSADADPATALNDNKKYKVVWDVLQALRAHDDRFEAMINKITLDPGSNKHLDVIAVGPGEPTDDDHGTESTGSHKGATDALFSMTNAAQWQNAIYARMVKKVGDRKYWEDWAKDVKDIADRQTTRIKSILDSGDTRAREEFEVFVHGLRGNLNASITTDDAVDMLVQHLITKPVFNALFEDYDFTAHNPVSQVMDSMLNVLDTYQLESETESLAGFYRSVRIRAEGITSAEGKQQIITELYERFFKLAFPRVAESLGIVYTPLEVVDFIIRAVDDVLKKDFGASVSDEGVHILDPFTGTGTFIVRLLQSGRIRPEDLLRKYTQELHANELLLMAYYIAALNIEATFHGLQLDQTSTAEHSGAALQIAEESGAGPVGAADGVGYVPFDGIVLTDTFQMTEDGDTLDEHVFTNNNDRAQAQNKLDIRVILGNPPYSVGQSSGNDNNANLKYPTLDDSIRTTYAARSTATNKNSLYDSYVRAIRWASNRILNSEHGGVVCYVSNGGYIDGNTADGLRKTLTGEFHDIYVYNLRGNQRTAGEQSRKEGGKIFDSGSRATVAILLLVKKPGPVTQGRLHYRDIGDYLTRQEKLQLVGEADLDSLEWDEITPNTAGDWINQRNLSFEKYPLIAEKGSKETIFAIQSGGLKTNRDAWVYNSSAPKLRANVDRMLGFYNSEVDRYATEGQGASVDRFINTDPTQFSWNRADKVQLKRCNHYSVKNDGFRTGTYRPFNRQHVYFDRQANDMVYRLNELFPDAEYGNLGIMLTAPSSHYPEFSALMTDALPDLHLHDSGQFFARYAYIDSSARNGGDQGDLFAGEEAASAGFKRVDNITDWALAKYRQAYGTQVTKDDVFHCVYGLLHSPEYRQRYAADLKKSLPRIPQVAGRDRFEAFVDAGCRLAELHMGYEDVKPYPLTAVISPVASADEYERFAVTKMRYGGKSGKWDKTRIRYNAYVELQNIPEEAQRYMLGSRSGIDWILERYQVKTDKASGILNDPNDWSREHGQPRYIIDLIGRVATVSVETMRIVDGLPDMGVER